MKNQSNIKKPAVKNERKIQEIIIIIIKKIVNIKNYQN